MLNTRVEDIVHKIISQTIKQFQTNMWPGSEQPSFPPPSIEETVTLQFPNS